MLKQALAILTLAAGPLAASTPALAEAPDFNGTWTVQLVTETGVCSGSSSYTVASPGRSGAAGLSRRQRLHHRPDRRRRERGPERAARAGQRLGLRPASLELGLGHLEGGLAVLGPLGRPAPLHHHRSGPLSHPR